jgi:hypothetical protein
MIDRADKRDLWLDPDDGCVKRRLFYRGTLVKLTRASVFDAMAFRFTRRHFEEMEAYLATRSVEEAGAYRAKMIRGIKAYLAGPHGDEFKRAVDLSDPPPWIH